jgi:phosphoglycerate dehydrogenase-like enzyme
LADGAVRPAPTASLGLLLSDAVDRAHGARLDAVAASHGAQLRRVPLSRAAQALDDIDIAFFSRELYEGSSLRQPGALSDAFFGVADAARNLRWLHVCSSGVDLPQYGRCIARGVRLTSSRGVTAAPIAQTVLAAILAQSRGFDHWLGAQSRREWAPLAGAQRPRDLRQTRVVVVGAGAIGMEIGRLLKAVGMEAIVVRRSACPTPPFDATLDFSQLDDVLPTCDWLVLAVPLTEQTRGLFDARRLALLAPRARIVNVARGELVDEPALCEALRAGRLQGAYLDTFAVEPLAADSPLWTMPNVWISPHNSAASQGHEERVVDAFVEQFEAWLQLQRETAPSP